VLGTARTARKRLLPAILRSGQSIVAIAGRDPARLAGFQTEFGIPHAFPWDQAQRVLDHRGVDAVYIPLPNSMHAEWTVRALEAGKQVLCEKPLTLTVAEADRVAAAALACNRVLMENFSYQLSPAYRDLPPLDALQSIDIHQSFFATEDHNLRYIRELGGGSFLDVGCYGVDFVHRLLDSEIEIAEVIASPPAPERGAPGLIDHASIESRKVDETCVLRGRAAGIAISITSSFAQPSRQDYTLHFAAGEQHQIVRTANPVALLDALAAASRTDPADILRWRRNASVYEQALERMQY